jgi:hypothetical protein
LCTKSNSSGVPKQVPILFLGAQAKKNYSNGSPIWTPILGDLPKFSWRPPGTGAPIPHARHPDCHTAAATLPPPSAGSGEVRSGEPPRLHRGRGACGSALLRVLPASASSRRSGDLACVRVLILVPGRRSARASRGEVVPAVDVEAASCDPGASARRRWRGSGGAPELAARGRGTCAGRRRRVCGAFLGWNRVLGWSWKQIWVPIFLQASMQIKK